MESSTQMSADTMSCEAEQNENKRRFVLREAKRREYPRANLFNELLDISARCLKEDDLHSFVDKVVKLRRKILLRDFYATFKCGELGKMFKPDEGHAYDRFDCFKRILEWIDWRIAAEDNIVYKLLCPDLDSVPLLEFRFYKSTRAALEESERIHNLVLDNIFEVFCTPLSQVAGPLLDSHQTVKFFYKLSLELENSSRSVQEQLSKQFRLVNTLCELHNSAWKKFLAILDINLKNFFQYPLRFPVELTPPEALRKVSTLLAEVLVIHDFRYPTATKLPLDYVKDAVFDPLIMMCDRARRTYIGMYGIDKSPLTISECDAAYVDTLSALETQEQYFLVKCLWNILLPLEHIRSDHSEEYITELSCIIMARYGMRVKETVDALVKKSTSSKLRRDYIYSVDSKKSLLSIVGQLLPEKPCTASSPADEETSSQIETSLDRL